MELDLNAAVLAARAATKAAIARLKRLEAEARLANEVVTALLVAEVEAEFAAWKALDA